MKYLGLSFLVSTLTEDLVFWVGNYCHGARRAALGKIRGTLHCLKFWPVNSPNTSFVLVIVNAEELNPGIACAAE